jgi:hypothetical protein
VHVDSARLRFLVLSNRTSVEGRISDGLQNDMKLVKKQIENIQSR